MKSLLLAIRDVLLWLTDRTAAVVNPRKSSRSDCVVLIRLDKLGDFVVWLDSARYLCDHLHSSGQRVTLVANAEWAALAADEAAFDEVWPVDVRRLRRNLPYRFRLITRLRKTGFRALYSLRVAKERALEDALVRAAGTPERVGVTGVRENMDDTRLRAAEGAYTRLAVVDQRVKSERLRNQLVLRKLGFAHYTASIARIVPRQITNEFALPHRYLAVVPGGGWAGRRWPIERFAELCEQLSELHGLPFVVLGSASETQLGMKLVAALPHRQIIDLVGRVPLIDLPSVLRGAALVISNETGPAHLAIAVGTETICIAGGGHFGRFVPDTVASGPDARPRLTVVNIELPCYGCNWRCPFISDPNDMPPCVSSISVGAVLTAVEDRLRLIER